MDGLQVSEDDVKLRESSFLSVLVRFAFNEVESGLKKGDLGITQGALRAVYNGIGESIHYSEYLSDIRIKLLEKFNNNVSGIRDDILCGVELDHKDFAEVVSSNNIHGRVGSARAALERYISYWYKS